MNRLSDLKIQRFRCPSGSDDVLLADGGNLFLRVRSTGAKTWVYRYRRGNKSVKLRLGSYPAVSLREARAAAQQLAIQRDETPELREKLAEDAAEKRRAAAAKAARLTVRQLYERWSDAVLSGRRDRGAAAKRLFDADVFPVLGEIHADSVTRGMVADACDRVKGRGSRVMARNLFGELRQMFAFAVKRELIELDPTAHLRRNDFGIKRERDRVLTEAEIRELLRRLEHSGLEPASRRMVLLMLATACRIGELAAAEWADVDLAGKVWRIPPEKSKNGRAHTVYLSDFAARVFTGQQNEAAQAREKHRRATRGRPEAHPNVAPSRFVFPATFKEGAPLDPKTLNKQLRDRQLGPMAVPLKKPRLQQHGFATSADIEQEDRAHDECCNEHRLRRQH